MSNQIFQLTTEETKVITHYKIARINVEAARTGENWVNQKDGYIEIWLAKVNIIEGKYHEIPDEPGVYYKIEGPEFDAFTNTPLGSLNSLWDIEPMFYGYFVQAGLIPVGSVILVDA